MIRKSLAIYWSAMRPRKWLWLIAAGANTIFFVIVNIVQPFVISRFIDALSDIAEKTMADFTVFLWIWVFIYAAQIGIGRIAIYSWYHAVAHTLKDIDLMSFRITLAKGSDFFANNFTGSLVTKFNRFTRSFDTVATTSMFDLNAMFVQVLFPFIVLMFVVPSIAIVLLCWAIVFAASLIFLHKKKLPRSKKVAEYDTSVTGAFADVVTNVMSVKMFTAYTVEFKTFQRLSRERVRARLRNMYFSDYIRIYKAVLILVLEVTVFWLSARLVLSGSARVADIVLAQFYVQQLVASLWNFGKIVDKLEEALADATEMAEVYDLTPSVLDSSSVQPLHVVRGEIVFDDVTFMYEDDKDTAVFKNFDLSIPVGQKVGLVGPSGGGKSTFTKLLLRFMNLDSGKILIDDQDIAQVSQDDLRNNIAYVPQEPLLFHRSIYDNIAYGDPRASKEEVFRAAQLAHADEFINKLPNGYDTLVGERGVKLSGGQKQRVAIARAMLKQAPILVLDEATSALDSKSEKLITEALDNLMKNRTTIVIAHRLSTIRKLDRVIVLNEGRTVEDGTHSGLLKSKGLYAELWAHQQGDFLEE